jgi:multidrug transporter EmrE-like cation transporter
MTVAAILLAVAGGVVYHVSAKSIPRDLAPALELVEAYATALAISALGHLSFSSGSSSLASLRLLHPAVLGLGVGAALIELGYVLTYRAAWPVSVASVVVNGIVAAALVPIGLVAFGEHLTWSRLGGMLLCLAGVWLLRS